MTDSGGSWVGRATSCAPNELNTIVADLTKRGCRITSTNTQTSRLPVFDENGRVAFYDDHSVIHITYEYWESFEARQAREAEERARQIREAEQREFAARQQAEQDAQRAAEWQRQQAESRAIAQKAKIARQKAERDQGEARWVRVGVLTFVAFTYMTYMINSYGKEDNPPGWSLVGWGCLLVAVPALSCMIVHRWTGLLTLMVLIGGWIAIYWLLVGY